MKQICTGVLFILFIGQCLTQTDSLLSVLRGRLGSPETIEEIQVTFNQTYYQNPDASLKLALSTDSTAISKNYISKFHITNLMLGIAYNINESYDNAIDHFLKAVDYAQEINEPKTEAQAYNGLAVVWQVRKDTETSALYFEKALEIYKSINDTLWTGIINLNLGGLYMEDELLEKADVYLEDAIEAMENMNQPIYAGYGRLNLGSLRVKQKNYDEAVPYLESALEVVPYQVNPLIHAVGNSALGETYLRKGRQGKSFPYLELALKQSREVKNYEQLEVVTGLLSEYHEMTGSPIKALTYYKESASLKDSFISKEEDERLINALKKYEAEKKEQEIMLLSAENEYKDLRNERDRRNLIFALLGIGLLAVIASLVLINRNRIKKLNVKLKAQKEVISTNLKEKELLLREIHHRVKNNLQVISSLLSLQSNYVKDDSALKALNLGKDRVKSMALIHQNLYQEGNLTGVKLKPYFEKLCKNLFDSYALTSDNISLDLDIEDIDLEIDSVIPLGLVANELITNALKHAFSGKTEGKIGVSLRKKDDYLVFTVEDNGKGVSEEQLNGQQNSFGYQMIHAFKEKLDADLIFNADNGLKVEMVIRDYVKL